MKRVFAILILCTVLLCGLSSFCLADTTTVTEKESISDNKTELPLLSDGAGLLNDAEYKLISEKLLSCSNKHNIDVVIVTVSTMPNGYSAQSFADDFYDYNGYGRGANHSGCLLLVDMNSRQWHISTTGSCINSINDKGIEYISDSILDDLKSGNYSSSFSSFIESVDYVVTCSENGTSIKTPFELIYLLIGVAIGLTVAAVTVFGMFRQLKTVRHKTRANDYLVEGSFALTLQKDIYLGTSVIKTPKPKNNNGSSVHTGSSGTSHGGGGGSF